MPDTILRPGSTLGIYPQRLENERSLFESIASHWLSLAGQAIAWRKYRMTNVVSGVNRAATDMDSLNDIDLNARCESIRHALRRDGLVDESILTAFALTREFATRILNMSHYDVQLFGAWVIVNGNMAEMATGEGKSFTATLAAATAGLAGIPVHVITTNEYLAQRDAQEFAPLYKAMSLSVASIVETMTTAEKKRAYLSDIVYCTNKQIAFDYLRDRLVSRNEPGRLSLKFGDANQSDQLLLRGLCFAILDEADSVLIDEARTPLILSREYFDEDRALIYEQALHFASELEQPRDFVILHREQRLELTTAGKARLSEQTQFLTGIWAGARHGEFLLQQALSAIYLFQKDHHYLVRDDRIAIIDSNTGRIMSDRSWQQGLHQMIECKEGCPITGQRETLASIGYQRFFKRYLRLGGMSGTLNEVTAEFRSIYQQRVIRIPYHRPSQQEDLGFAVYRRAQDKQAAVLDRIRDIHRSGQPVLVGTCSVYDSEQLGQLLSGQKLPHRILNARQDKDEAEIIGQAGQRGQITVATNMAGRGTDIKLGPGVAELGGLHVIATECHEGARVDRQLYGRSARQGNPGSYEALLSLNDALVQEFYPVWMRRLFGRYVDQNRPYSRWGARLMIWLPQQAKMRRHRSQRRDLLHQDEQLGKMLAWSGRQE